MDGEKINSLGQDQSIEEEEHFPLTGAQTETCGNRLHHKPSTVHGSGATPVLKGKYPDLTTGNGLDNFTYSYYILLVLLSR
jgi:hypothetical protein